MSSAYRILCLSHDPAVVVDGFETLSMSEAEGALLANRFSGHPHCDLVVGRYSYPLIEAGVVVGRTVTWQDADWLRLLALAQTSPDGSALREAALKVERVWSKDRLRRLRFELNLEVEH